MSFLSLSDLDLRPKWCDRPADLIPVTAARELIPSRKKNRRLDVGTLYRWVQRGYLRGVEVVGGRETLQAEPLRGLRGYKTLLFENNTNMPYAVAATAWGHLIGCNTFNDHVFDALRAFRLKYIDKTVEAPLQPPNNTG